MVLTEQQIVTLFKERFIYKDGNLYWANGPKKNKKAGYINKNGYSTIRITYAPKKHKLFLLHRVVFALHHNYLPSLVDHIDQNPSNNKIENLRHANKTINSINTGLSVKNKSGVKGVCFNKGKWDVFVHIKEEGKRKKLNLGRFKNLEDAKRARKNWERANWANF
jgi:hypothetical protein